MDSFRISAPESSEYASFYAGYVAAVAGQDIRSLLEQQPHTLHECCASLSDAQANFRYAPGKWSVKEIIGHLSDAERVFAYRLFRISRGDTTPLPGFDENQYVAVANSDDRTLEDLLDEFATVREATLRLLKTIAEPALRYETVASGTPVSVRAQLHIIAGHVAHHLNILHERYHV